MPVNASNRVNAVLRKTESLSIGSGAREKNVGKWIPGSGARAGRSGSRVYANPTIERLDHRAISATVVGFNLGICAEECADLEDMVTVNLGEVVLNRIEVFMVAIRRDVPNGL